MNNSEFDSRIRELVDSYQEPVGEDLWGGIEQGLRRRNSAIWFRRVGIAVAVAASLVVGLVLIPKVEERPSVMLAQNIEIESEGLRIDEIAPSAMQKIWIKSRPVATASDGFVDESDVETEAILESVPKPSDNIIEETSPELESPEKVKKDVEESYDDSWIYDDEGEVQKAPRGVVVGVSSNMLAFNGDGKAPSRPQYMPGSSMNIQSGIAPISKPTFGVPLSFGLQIQVPIGNRLAIGTGLNYTYLQSSFSAVIDNTSQALVDQSIHYMGVPLSLYVNVLKNNNFSCYATVGGAVEKGLLISNRVKDIFDGVEYRKSGVSGVQWSANIGVGMQYFFTDFFGIYLDPSVVYFFDSKQPYSVRTAQPLQFEMELGLRFNL